MLQKTWVRVALVLLAILIAVPIITLVALNEPRPEATASPEADALARKIMAAVDTDGWRQTGAVSWNFGGRQQHLWDRRRHLDQVRWDEVEVLVDLNTQKGLALRGGHAVEGTEGEALVAKAYAFWVNDGYWLNPIDKFFDPGVTRALTTDKDGRQALLVAYGEGGLTPGDAYLWSVNDAGIPTKWQMWVNIIPIGGLTATWDDWTTLPTGAKLAGAHKTGPVTLELTDIKGAANLSDLVKKDPFCRLPTIKCDAD